MTFINGSSGALETTYVTPSPNFFRFNMRRLASGSRASATYIYNEKKWRKIATLAEDYSFPYTQLFGFIRSIASSAARSSRSFWVPLGTKDFASIIAKLPDDVDAIYLGLGGGDAVNFFNQYARPAARRSWSAARSWSTRPCCRQGQRQAHRDRHSVGRPAGRRLGQSEMERLGEALPGLIPGR